MVDREDIDAISRVQEQTLRLEPDNILIVKNIGLAELQLSRPEISIRAFQRVLSILSHNDQQIIRAEAIGAMRNTAQFSIDGQLGAFHDAAPDVRQVLDSGVRGLAQPSYLAQAQTGEHDLAAARATMADVQDVRISLVVGSTALQNIWARIQIDGEAQDWAGVLALATPIDPLLAQYPGLRSTVPRLTTPLIAYADAKLGNIAAAEARIAATPADCYICLRMRARIAELRGQRGRADWWFARAASQQPSIPFAYSDWGEALLARGDADGAIAKFIEANKRGPHFADPLELWGEALMTQHHPDLALAKFGEANKYAPNWGRLHLKWGEALAASSKADDARAQFARAAGLDLTPAERTELGRARAQRSEN